MPRRTAWFAVVVLVAGAAFATPLAALAEFAFHHEQYSHIVLIPLASAALVIYEARRIFARPATSWRAGAAIIGTGVVVALAGRLVAVPSTNDRLSLAIAPLVVVWIGGFVLSYGLRASRQAAFALLFLLLMVPIPDAVLSVIVFWLQSGSAEVAEALFQLTGIPMLRTGFVFTLPGVTIEIAQECSGIRSSLALIITSLLAGHLFLRSPWRRAALTLAALPLLVVKNGIRIVTLSLLSIYVDPKFLHGDLHRHGGVVFFVLTAGILAMVLRLLEKSESPRRVVPVEA